MIEELENHLTQEQIDGIKTIIANQYQSFKHLNNTPEYRNLYLDEYSAHRRQHNISWAIASGFPNNGNNVGGLRNICFKYNGGHTCPMLQNERFVIHILNDTTNFDAQYLKSFYKKNENNFSGEQLYCYVKFLVEGTTLTEITLCLPDETGMVVENEVLLARDEMCRLAG